MKFLRTGLLLLLLGTGIVSILLGRCGKKLLPPGPSLPPAPSAPGIQPPRQGSASRPASAPASRPARTQASSRKPLEAEDAAFLEGIVVDRKGLPVEGARVEALAKPPASSPPLEEKVRLLEALQETLMKKAGRGRFSPWGLAGPVRRRLFTTLLPAGPLEPHTLSGKGGVFRLGPLPRRPAWLWARKGASALRGFRKARPGKPVVLVLLPSASLEITLLDSGRRSISSCPVYLAEGGGPSSLGPGLVSTRLYRLGRTGKEGKVSFQGLPPPGPYLALALPEDRPLVFSDPIFLQEGGRKGITLLSPPGGDLELQVRKEEKEEGIAGVLVRILPLDLPLELGEALRGDPAVTGGEGRISFTNLAPGEWLVQAFTPGRMPGHLVCRIRPGRTTRLTLALSKGAGVKGLVQDEKGRPLPGALAGANPLVTDRTGGSLPESPFFLLDPRFVTRAGPGGRFLLEGLPPRPLSLSAVAEGYLPARLYGVRPGRKDTVVLTLRRPGAAEGRVVGPGGRPVETFSIRPWMELGRTLREPLPEKTFHDRGGRFRLGGLSRGTYTLSVKAEGLAERRVEGLKVEPGRTLSLPSPIRLQAGSVVEGSVADPRGRPCPAVRIVLSPAGSPRFLPPSSFPPLETFTGPDGRFRVEEVPPGKWRISARGGPRGWAEREEPLQTGPDRIQEDLRLRLLPPASLEGQVYDPRGRPAKGADLRLSRMEGTFLSRATRADSRGRFFLAGLPPGKWYLTALDRPTLRDDVLAREEQLKTGELPREILHPRMRSALVELAPGEKGKITLGAPSSALGALEGRVTSGGRPIEGAKVMILSMDPAHRFTSAPPTAVFTDQEGRFQVEGLPGGEYLIWILAQESRGPRKSWTVTLRNGKRTRLEAAFGSCVVEGRLLPKGKCRSLEGRTVLLMKEGKTVAAAVTDEEGRFRMKYLNPGTYQVVLQPDPDTKKGDPLGALGPIQVGGTSRLVKVTLPVQGAAALEGRVLPAPGEKLEVQVRVEGWKTAFSAETDEKGTFRIQGIPPGRTTLVVQGKGKRGSARVTTLPGGTARVVLPLEGQ